MFKSFYYIDCTRVEARLQELDTYLPGEDERATPLGTKRLWRRIGAGAHGRGRTVARAARRALGAASVLVHWTS